MKSFLFACCLTMLAWATSVSAHQLAVVPPDTLMGEARLTRLFAQGICEQIALESRHQDLAVLTRAQGMALIQDMLSAVIMRDSVDFKAFAAKAPDAEAAVQRLTLQAVLRLPTFCPAASKLFTQMGVQMAGFDTTLTAGQLQLLQAVAHDFCDQLTAADTQQAFSRRTAPERIAAFQEVRHKIILAHGQALLAAFGEQLLTNQQLESTMWQNVDRLMFDQCPALIGQLRVDQGLAQLQEAEAPEPKPLPQAPARPPARTARKK